MAFPLLVSFSGGSHGCWEILSNEAVCGESLPPATRLHIVEGPAEPVCEAAWTLRGETAPPYYTNRAETAQLTASQQGLHRPEATRAALIPIRKTRQWWDLEEHQRRNLLEERSHHIAIGLEYLPAIARRLHHSRNLGEPFDFLTWFEYAPEHTRCFDELVRRLRDTPEWTYVDREIDIRLARL